MLESLEQLIPKPNINSAHTTSDTIKKEKQELTRILSTQLESAISVFQLICAELQLIRQLEARRRHRHRHRQ